MLSLEDALFGHSGFEVRERLLVGCSLGDEGDVQVEDRAAVRLLLLNGRLIVAGAEGERLLNGATDR